MKYHIDIGVKFNLFVIFFSFGFLIQSISAQNSVRGTVKSQTEAISYANVILFNAADSALVKGGISDGKAWPLLEK